MSVDPSSLMTRQWTPDIQEKVRADYEALRESFASTVDAYCYIVVTGGFAGMESRPLYYLPSDHHLFQYAASISILVEVSQAGPRLTVRCDDAGLPRRFLELSTDEDAKNGSSHPPIGGIALGAREVSRDSDPSVMIFFSNLISAGLLDATETMISEHHLKVLREATHRVTAAKKSLNDWSKGRPEMAKAMKERK